ncbi:hypothetical protein IWQ60_002334 [Tieghemiomyces parasiticus]|uniref:Xylanolytic transcriptional activator regulatory domain-containing protein n=1 Tax=Tieghemiomyces parasiticus TaxID=78921 RepID=A0A9W8AI74_9FUNG|nr:hypothetical protein IWQ60_002334 [Tieghemiomyces parasiticus]
MRDVLKTKSLSLSSLAPLATAVAPTSLSPTLPHHASADAPRSPSQATTLSSCAASDIDHQLITDYFEFLAPQIPVLHRPTFHQQILQRTIPQFLLDTVYALAARISRRPSAILGGRFEVSEKYATRARRALPTGEAANTLLGLQATVLLCLYELAVGHSDAGLNLCDEAWRIFHKLWTSQPALTGITTAGSLARGSRLDEIRRWLYDETLSRIMWTLISIRAGAARSRSIPCTVADIDQLPVSFPCDDWLWQRDALALGTDLGSCPPHLLMSLPVSGSALQALCTAASDAPDQLDYMPRPLVAHLNHRTNPFVKESPHLTRRGGLPYGDGHTKTWWEDLRSPTTMFNQLSFHSPASAQFPPDVIPPPPVSDSDPISGTTTSTNRAGLRLDTLTAILTLTVLANRSVRVRQVWHVNAGDPQAVIVSYRQVSAALRWWQQETNAELVDQTCYAAELAPQTTTTTTTLTSSSPLWSSLRQSAVLVPLLSKPEPEWAFHKSTEASLLSLGILYLSVQLELAYYAWSALRDLPAQSDGHHHQQQHKLPQPQHPVDLTMIPPQLVAADLWTECLHLVHECVALVQITHDVQLESLHGCVPQCVVSVVYIIRRLIEQRSALPKNIGNNNPMADDDTDASVERDALVTALSLLTDCLDQLYRYWHIPESETPPSPSPLTKCEK